MHLEVLSKTNVKKKLSVFYEKKKRESPTSVFIFSEKDSVTNKCKNKSYLWS